MKKLLLFVALLGIFAEAKAQAVQKCDAVFADDNVVLASVNGKMYRSVDDGATFSHILPAGEDDLTVRCIAKVNNTFIIGAINGSNRIFRSVDNGETWTASASGMPGIAGFVSAVPRNAITVQGKVFMGGTNFFRVSNDEGLTWETLPDDGMTNALDYTGSRLWRSSYGAMRYSEDLGATWQQTGATPFFGGNAASAFAEFPGLIVVASTESNYQCTKRSFNNGASWEATLSVANAKDMILVNDVLYTTAFSGFHKSTDQGATWTIEGCSSYQDHAYGGTMHLHNGTIWIASANGPIRYSVADGTCEVLDIFNTAASEDIQANISHIVYPNPATDLITISNAENDVEVLITDMTGKVVASTVVKSNSPTIDTSGLSGGLYFVSARYDDGLISRTKLIISR